MARSERIPEMIDSGVVRNPAEAQAIRGATVLGQPGGGRCWCAMAPWSGRSPRPAGSCGPGISTARRPSELGLAHFEVDASGHEEADGHRRARPGRAVAALARGSGPRCMV